MKYFLFYKKAYKTLEDVFRFRQKKFQCAHNVAYDPEEGDNNVHLLKSLHGMKINEFNDWFNKAFDKSLSTLIFSRTSLVICCHYLPASFFQIPGFTPSALKFTPGSFGAIPSRGLDP